MSTILFFAFKLSIIARCLAILSKNKEKAGVWFRFTVINYWKCYLFKKCLKWEKDQEEGWKKGIKKLWQKHQILGKKYNIYQNFP